MAFNSLESSLLDAQRENYIGLLKGSIPLADNGWSTYSNASGISPVSGLGGTASSVLSLDSSSPISGDSDLKFSKDASNRQGEGFGYSFSIAKRHLGKLLQITFDSNLVSGTYSTGDLRVYIIQNPTGTPVVLEPVNVTIQTGIVGVVSRQIATFQTHATITSYRLCIHVASTSASSYVLNFNNFKVWEQQQNLGAIITDWQSYTPTSPNSAYTLTSSQMFWRRVGGNLELQGEVVYNTTSGIQFRFPLPNGLTVTSNYTTSKYVGKANVWVTVTNYKEFSLKANGGNSYLTIGVEGETTGSGSISTDILANDYAMSSAGKMTFIASVPITGWGSSVAMSSDTGDGRVVAMKVHTLTDNESPRKVGNKFTFSQTEYDTHSGWSAANGEYTVPVSGYYSCKWQIYASAATNIVLYKDSTPIAPSYGVYSDNIFVNGSNSIYCNAGQKISIQSGISTSGSTASISFFAVERISAGSQVIATQETVAFRVTKTSNSTQGTGLIDIVCDSSTNTSRNEFDTHGAYNTSTGVFTAPVSGVYQFNIFVHMNGTFSAGTGDSVQVTDISNNIIQGMGSLVASGNYVLFLNGSFSMRMISGQQIKFRANRGNNIYVGGLTSQSTSIAFTTISGSRIGI